MQRLSIIPFVCTFSVRVGARIFCLQSFLVVVLASATGALAFARASDVPKCRLNSDVAAYLRGGEDAADQAAVIEPAPAVAPETAGKCGKGTELIDTLKASPIRVRFSGGGSLDL